MAAQKSSLISAKRRARYSCYHKARQKPYLRANTTALVHAVFGAVGDCARSAGCTAQAAPPLHATPLRALKCIQNSNAFKTTTPVTISPAAHGMGRVELLPQLLPQRQAFHQLI